MPSNWQHSGIIEATVLNLAVFHEKARALVLSSVDEADFYNPQNAMLYRTVHKLFIEGHAINMATIIETAPRDFKEETLSAIADLAVDEDMASFSIAKLKEYTVRRDAAWLVEETRQQIMDVTINPFETIAAANTGLTGLATRHGSKGLVTMDESVSECFTLSEKAKKEGLKGIDPVVSGIRQYMPVLPAQTLTVIAAESGVGKTSYAMQIVKGAAQKGITSLIYSLEMSSRELTYRFLAAEAEIPIARLRAGCLSEGEWMTYAEACQKVNLFSKNILLSRNPRASTATMATDVRMMSRDKDIGLVVLDYIQLMARNEKGENETQRISSVSAGAKEVSTVFDIPVIALSQFSKHDGEATSANLRGSGTIKNDADNILIIHREVGSKHARIVIDKHRNGPVGSTNVEWNGLKTEFN